MGRIDTDDRVVRYHRAVAATLAVLSDLPAGGRIPRGILRWQVEVSPPLMRAVLSRLWLLGFIDLGQDRLPHQLGRPATYVYRRW